MSGNFPDCFNAACPKCWNSMSNCIEMSLPEQHKKFKLLGPYPFIGRYCGKCGYVLLIVPSKELKAERV